MMTNADVSHQLYKLPTSVSVEITTKCNFDCDYCYSKQYPDDMMSFDQFKQVVDRWLSADWRIEFNLTGEGEGLLHPNIWQFVEYIKANSTHTVALITNGSALNEYHRNQVVRWLDRISVSVDTTDPIESERIGRHNIDRVISNIRALTAVFNNITIMTVDYGQSLSSVKSFVRELGLNHYIQPLQQKADYSSVYTTFPIRPRAPQRAVSYTCTELANRRVVYNIQGIAMPCCYIKDISSYPGYDRIIQTFTTPTNQTIPGCCIGCAKLQHSHK